MSRYIGLDVHKASCTMVVVGPSGKKISSHVLETRGDLLVDLLKTIPRPRLLCIEEGTQSAWLYEVLSPHVQEMVVTVKREHSGPKDDARDALDLAEKLRNNAVKVRVYKEVKGYGRLRQLSRVHLMQVQDSVRLKNRIIAMFTSRGIETEDSIYDQSHREEWLSQLPISMQTAADSLMRQHDAVEPLRRESEKTMLKEAQKHPIWKILRTMPGLGPIRSAQLMSVVVTPHRFRTRSQLWQYSGLGIVMRSSSDWVQGNEGNWRRDQVQTPRGLNRNHNHLLKSIFKSAATTVVAQANKDCPIYQHYQQMLQNKTKPNLAKLTIARQIAAITLSLWKKEVAFDPAKLKKTS